MLTSLDAANAVVEVDQRQVTVKIAQAAYIAFNTELAYALRPKGAYALILLDNRVGRGGRISLTSAGADNNMLTGTTVFGAIVRVPLREIACSRFDPGKLCLSFRS